MKIALLSLFDNPEAGGGPRVLFELAAELQKRGHQVVVICPSDEGGEHVGKDGIKRYSIPSIGQTSKRIPNLTNKKIEEFYAYLDEFSPDVLHAHTMAYIAVLGQIWAIKNRKPFIYTSHEILSKVSEFFTTSVYLKKIFGPPITNIFTKDFIKNCDGIISINYHVDQDLKKLGYNRTVYHISNGRDLSMYQNCKLKQFDPKRIELVFVGIVCERKNQSFLIKVLSYLPENYHLKLIGNCDDEKNYFKGLKILISDLNLKNVTFTGLIPHEKIVKELEKSDIFVSASKAEVQSLAVIEAMAAGKPIIGLENETISELIDSENGIVLNKDAQPEEFADQIMSFVENTDFSKVFEANRKKSERFNLTNVVDSTIQAYEDAIKNYSENPNINSKEKINRYLKFVKDLDVRRYLTEIFLGEKSIPEKKQKISRRKSLFILGTAAVSVLGYFVLKSLQNQKSLDPKLRPGNSRHSK